MQGREGVSTGLCGLSPRSALAGERKMGEEQEKMISYNQHSLLNLRVLFLFSCLFKVVLWEKK